MNFRDFLLVAQGLSEEKTEAEWRSGISRSYYALFHVASDLLTMLGFRVPRMDRGHAFLWLRLSNSSNPDISQAGRDLNKLRSDRNTADYDKRPAISQTDAEDAWKIAQLAVAVFDSALNEPIRTEITEAIKIYERDVLKEVTYQPAP